MDVGRLSSSPALLGYEADWDPKMIIALWNYNDFLTPA
jgi:hypothetical protein